MDAADNRRIARNTLFLYIRTFVTMLIGLYTSRKILEVLGVDDFGIYNIVGGVIVMMSFLSSSMNVAIGRYLTVELGRKDYEAYNRVFNISLIIQLSLALAVVLIAETVGLWFVNTQLVIPEARMHAANWVYQAAIVTTVISIINSPFGATIGAHERMHIYAYVGLGEAFAKLAIVISLFWCPWDKLAIWAIAMMGVSLLSISFQILYCRRQFPHCAIRPHWDRGMFRSMASFSGWNLFGTVAWALKDQGVNVVLNLFGGPAINAARGVALQVRGAVTSLTGGFQGAVSPQLTKNFAANDISATHLLLFRSSKISFFLLLIPAIPICFEISYLLSLWLVKVPDYATLFTVLVVIETLCEVFGGPTITTLMATGHIKWYQIVVGSLLMLNVPVAYVLLRVGLPIYVPFLVSIFFVIASQGSRLIFCRRLAGMSIRAYLSAVVSRCLIVTAASLIVPTLIYFAMPETLLRLFVLSAATICTTAAAIWLLGLDRNERTFIRNIIGAKFGRIFNKTHIA